MKSGGETVIKRRMLWRFSCVKQKKMPATDEITSYHENQITPKQTILATDFQ